MQKVSYIAEKYKLDKDKHLYAIKSRYEMYLAAIKNVGEDADESGVTALAKARLEQVQLAISQADKGKIALVGFKSEERKDSSTLARANKGKPALVGLGKGKEVKKEEPAFVG